MGFQLWISPNTGIRRKGTTFKELQNIFIDNITVKLIYEPIYCCNPSDNGFEVRSELRRRDFDIIGVIDSNENVKWYAVQSEINNNSIEHFMRKIKLKDIISSSTPIPDLLNILSRKAIFFVVESDKVVGVITRADINKPIVRIYVFGLISLFELHLNYWIVENYKEIQWEEKISKKRLDTATKLFGERKGKNESLTLLECLQLCDKRDVLLKTDPFINRFGFTRLKFKKLLTDAEKIRNELAHSQNSIVSNLPWQKFAQTINELQVFLHKSESIVESEIAARQNP